MMITSTLTGKPTTQSSGAGATVNEVRHRLKALRNRAGLRSRDVAALVDMPASSYQKYEDRRRGAYLPLQMVAKLVLALEPHGIEPEEVWSMADQTEITAFHRAWALHNRDSSINGYRMATPDHPAALMQI